MKVTPKLLFELRLTKRHEDNIGLLIIKPGCPENISKQLEDFCKENMLKIIERKKVTLTKNHVVALYPKIYSFDENDLRYGIKWKKLTIDYLTSGKSAIFWVMGENATKSLQEFKRKTREQYGKVSNPTRRLNPTEFYETVIKNIVHCLDREDLDVASWLFA